LTPFTLQPHRSRTLHVPAHPENFRRKLWKFALWGKNIYTSAVFEKETELASFMVTLLTTIIVPLLAMFIIIGVWTTVHLLALKRVGVSEIGCHGPTVNDRGEAVCCKGDKLCDMPPQPQQTTDVQRTLHP
jgi:hypothetical protein